jgi:hypothetical protein
MVQEVSYFLIQINASGAVVVQKPLEQMFELIMAVDLRVSGRNVGLGVEGVGVGRGGGEEAEVEEIESQLLNVIL